MSKGHRSQTKELPMAKPGTNWNNKINNAVLYYKLKYKINVHKCMLI